MEIQISRLISFNTMTWINGIKIKNEALRFYLTWIIHESRLPQVRGTAQDAVVVHRSCAVTK
jgi:hypothetical protein